MSLEKIKESANRTVVLLSALPVTWEQVDLTERDATDPDIRSEEIEFLRQLLPGTDPVYVSRNLAVARASAVAASANPETASLEWVCRYVALFFGEASSWSDTSAALLAAHAFDGQVSWAERWRSELLEGAYELRITDTAKRTDLFRGEF